MAVYVVQGKLGTGKTKYCVGKMREALLDGRRVATNLDLDLSKLVPARCKGSVVRLPDKPSAEHLGMMGHGNPDTYDEDRNGVLVLDELGSWLNSRSFQDRGRAALIDWLIHARKHGWDAYLIVQHLNMVDKQVREALAEYVVRTIRADKVRIPVIGQFMGDRGRLPRFHVARISLSDAPGLTIDRDFFRGDDLHDAYDTRQIFKDDPEARPYSMLSAWHLVGRHQEPTAKRGILQRLFSRPAPARVLKPKAPMVAWLQRLEPDRRVYWAKRLQQAGLA